MCIRDRADLNRLQDFTLCYANVPSLGFVLQGSFNVLAIHYPQIVSNGMPLLKGRLQSFDKSWVCLLYTSDAADDLLCVDIGGRRIIKKKNKK